MDRKKIKTLAYAGYLTLIAAGIAALSLLGYESQARALLESPMLGGMGPGLLGAIFGLPMIIFEIFDYEILGPTQEELQTQRIAAFA